MENLLATSNSGFAHPLDAVATPNTVIYAPSQRLDPELSST